MLPRYILLLSCLLISLSILAQSPCQPILSQAQAALDRGNTEQALRKLQDVEICDDNNTLIRQRQRLQNAIFAQVNEQRQAAIKAQAEAETERETARQALADLAASQERIQVALDRAQKLVDAIPFYDGKYAIRHAHVPGVDWNAFALGTPYHFIDKEGVSVDKLGLWRSAELFDEDGYARVVTSGGLKLVIDTTGKSFSVAYGFSELFQNVEIAYLGNTLLDSITYISEKAPNLKVLFLDGMEVTSEIMPPLLEMLTKLDSLEALSLSRCRLTEFPREILQLTNLKKLDLSENQLTAIPLEIGQLEQLKELRLNGNNLAEFPPGITDLKDLEVLTFRENIYSFFGNKTVGKLINMPSSLFSLSKLVVLDFYNDTLTQIPAAIAEMTQLRKLTLQCEALENLPSSLTHLRKLEKLEILGGSFDVFPAEMTQLNKLEELRITNTNLKQLPEEIGALQELIVLDVSENKIQRLPESLCLLRQLKELGIFSNELEYLPADIGNFRRLTELKISDNQLKAIPASIGKLVNLNKLSLGNNQLTNLPSEIGNLHRLSVLGVGVNKLAALPPEIWQLRRLFSLGLNSNQLTALPAGIEQVEHLTYLSLQNNNISSFPEGMGQLESIHILNVSDNDLSVSALEALRISLPQHTKIVPDIMQTYAREKNYPKLYELQKAITIERNSTKGSDWENLSNYAFYVNEYSEALYAAQKSLEFNRNNDLPVVNLAFAYLLTNQWDDAEKIFLEWKGKAFGRDGDLADLYFLSMLEDMEARGIAHPDFTKVRALFD